MSNKILIVDEDRLIRESYEGVLKSGGYEVEAALDGREALDKMMQNSYDLVLLDIMLPKLDGIGIIRELSESTSKTPINSVIFFTNLSEDPVVKEALETGVHSCLVKADTSPDQLLAHVQAALGEKPASSGQSNSKDKAEDKPEERSKIDFKEKKSQQPSAESPSAAVEDL